MHRINGNSHIIAVLAIAITTSVLVSMQVAPAFAVTRTYPVYSNCNFVTVEQAH